MLGRRTSFLHVLMYEDGYYGYRTNKAYEEEPDGIEVCGNGAVIGELVMDDVFRDEPPN